jgi:large subunit ribosomal protein L23
MNAYDIIKRPLLSEKSYATIADKKYTFVVEKSANKVEIRKAVEEIFKVKVQKVNTLIVKGKEKTQNTKNGRTVGKTSDYKKAIVWLTADSKPIEFFESLN